MLDTWFSSALWPFSTLGWPDNTRGFERYSIPPSVLVSGYDIIFFWVARMIFSGIEQMGEVPFKTVVMHGLVRDEQGRKMSKSLGNGIDPFSRESKTTARTRSGSLLALGVSPGNDMRVSEKKFDACRNFANKVWNASRFVVMNLDGKAVPMEGRRLTLAEQVDTQPLQRGRKGNQQQPRRIRHRQRRAEDIRFPRGSEFCDGQHRAGQAAPAGRRRGEPRHRARRAGIRAYRYAKTPAPVHAVPDRRGIPLPAGHRGHYHAQELARVQARVRVRRRKRADAGHHGRDKCRAQPARPL